MNRNHALSVAAACAFAASPCAAQDDAKFLKAAFDRMDQDKDGIVVRAEFPGSDRQYAAIDADKNGKATLAEFSNSEVGKSLVRARYRSKDEPRERVTGKQWLLLRFDAAMRCDLDRDGKVAKGEWSGTEVAFLELDLDGNGVIDKRDRAEATAELPEQEAELPDVKGELLGVDEWMKRFDKDGNAVLSSKEITDKWLRAAMPFGDKDKDGSLTENELRELLQAAMQRRQENDRVRARPQPYDVPFDAWDKDDDEKVRQNEWMGPLGLFAQIDVDRDAAVTRDEALRYRKRVLGQDFVERFDLNGDGKVSLEEFAGPTGAFRRADRSGDGSVTRQDR